MEKPEDNIVEEEKISSASEGNPFGSDEEETNEDIQLKISDDENDRKEKLNQHCARVDEICKELKETELKETINEPDNGNPFGSDDDEEEVEKPNELMMMMMMMMMMNQKGTLQKIVETLGILQILLDLTMKTTTKKIPKVLPEIHLAILKRKTMIKIHFQQRRHLQNDLLHQKLVLSSPQGRKNKHHHHLLIHHQ